MTPREQRAAMLGLYAQLKNVEWQIGQLRRDMDRIELKVKEVITTLISTDKELEEFQ